MKALQKRPLTPPGSHSGQRLSVAVLVLLIVAFLQGTVYGQHRAGPRSAGPQEMQEAQVPSGVKAFGYKVPIPEIKLKSIIGGTPSRKAPPKEEPREQIAPTAPQPPRQRVEPGPDNSDLPEVTRPVVPRLPFERAHPVKREKPAKETTSAPPERPVPQLKVPLATPPKTPDEILEARPPRKEVLAAPSVAFKPPALLENEPRKQAPKELRLDPGPLSSPRGTIALRQRRPMERVVLVPSQPEFDALPPKEKPGSSASARKAQSDESPATAVDAKTAPGLTPPPRTVEAHASPREKPRVARAVPPLELLPPEKSPEERSQPRGTDKIQTASPAPTVVPPTRRDPAQSAPPKPVASAGTDRSRRNVPAIAIAPPAPPPAENPERARAQVPPLVVAASPQPGVSESAARPQREIPAIGMTPPAQDQPAVAEKSREKIPSVATAPPVPERLASAEKFRPTIPPIAMATPKPGHFATAEKSRKKIPAIAMAPPTSDHPAIVEKSREKIVAMKMAAPEPDHHPIAEKTRERIPAIAMTPPAQDDNEISAGDATPHPTSGVTAESEQRDVQSAQEPVASPNKVLMARAHPSPEVPVEEPREPTPPVVILPSPLDMDARESREVRDYLRATAPVLEELSLLITTAPTLAITNYDPTELGGPAVLKDVLLKLNSMKRALQILDSKTFAIIPPAKYADFHTTIRQSITQTCQACDSIITFLNSGKEDQLAKIHEHLSKARELMQKTRSRRG